MEIWSFYFRITFTALIRYTVILIMTRLFAFVTDGFVICYTEVNFFEWFDNYYKPKFLAGRNTNTNPLLQRDKSTNHTHRISNTPSSTPSLTPLTKTHACDIPDTNHNKLLTPTTDNIDFATKQNLMTINNKNQQDNINLAKKLMQTINRTTQNWLKVESKEVVHEEFPPYESIIINHRNQQLLASFIKNVSLSDETKNFEKIIEQNNYSKTYLKIIGAKLDRIENKIDPINMRRKVSHVRICWRIWPFLRNLSG